jgi:ankyrin repeat protein
MGDLELCTLLVDHGANVNAKDNYGITALITAAARDKWVVVNFLLQKKAYHRVMSDDGYTALAIAKCGKHKETIKVLKKFGVKK